MSLIYFWLDVFCQFKARGPEFDTVQRTVYTVAGEGRGCVSNSGTLASNTQNTASPKLNDDISMLISQYFSSEVAQVICLAVKTKRYGLVTSEEKVTQVN